MRLLYFKRMFIEISVTDNYHEERSPYQRRELRIKTIFVLLSISDHMFSQNSETRLIVSTNDLKLVTIAVDIDYNLNLIWTSGYLALLSG